MCNSKCCMRIKTPASPSQMDKELLRWLRRHPRAAGLQCARTQDYTKQKYLKTAHLHLLHFLYPG